MNTYDATPVNAFHVDDLASVKLEKHVVYAHPF